MSINATSMMTYADNFTVTTVLSNCISPWNVTQTVEDLYNLYQSNVSSLVSNVSSNISIINFDCNSSNSKYFEQIITLTKVASIRTQIAFASIYFDYILSRQYNLSGFMIDPEAPLNLSSVTLNFSAQSDACSSGDAAQDPLCSSNNSTPICIQPFHNPWIFNCSKRPVTSTISSLPLTNNNEFSSTTVSTILNSWQIGLACGLSVLFLLILLLVIGHFLRRYSRSKRIALSSENLVDDMKSMQKSGTPYGQAFQRATTIVQPRRADHTAISRINNATHEETYINLKPAGPYNQGTFIDHAKVHDPVFPSNIPNKPATPPIYNVPADPYNTPPSKVFPTKIISRPVSGTSTSQLKSITDGLEEDRLDESDSISLDRSSSPSSKKPGTPVSRQFANSSFIDESLHDEDAWMSILAVANAELDVLDQLENEQNRIRTLM